MKSITHIVLNNFINDARVFKACILMREHGYNVQVICLKSNETPNHEIIQGIEIYRISLLSKKLHRIFSFIKYLEFFFRVQKYLKKADLVHVNDFEPLPIVWFAKMSGGNFKTLYDAHEFASERNGLNNFLRTSIRLTEKFFGGFCDEIITVSESISKEYRRIHKRKKIEVVLNVPLLQLTISSSVNLRDEFKIPNKKKIFLYQGRLLINRGIEFLIEAFDNIHPDAVLVFMGSGTLEDKVKKAAALNNKIYHKTAVPYNDLLAYTSSADFGLMTAENVCLSYKYCMPNKLFEYINAGIPIITTNLKDCSEFVIREKIGLVLYRDNAEGVRNTINFALESNKQNYSTSLAAASAKYNWDREKEKLYKIYIKLLEGA